jgi:hypothetical protein
MAETDAISICSEALVLLGERPIANFEEGTDQALSARQLYTAAAQKEVAAHPWHFARKFVTLARLTAAPPIASGYSAAYTVPLDAYHRIAFYVAGEKLDDYMLAETQMWCEADAAQEVALHYHGWVDEALWTPMFRQGLVFRMAEALAVPIRDSVQMRDAYKRDAELQLARARHQNAKEAPAQVMPTGVLEALRAS